MDKKPSKKKERAKNYEKKLVVDATFDEVIDMALGKVPAKKETKKPK
jgi:hypothetical protein